MKKMYFLLLGVLVLHTAAFTQQTAFNDFIDRYKNEKGVDYAFLSKEVFEVAVHSDLKDNDWKKVQNIVKNLGSLSILTADSTDKAIAWYKEALQLVPDQEMDELLSIRDGNEKVRLWAKTTESTVSDLILIVGSTEEFVLICFSGVLDLNNITDLAQLFSAKEASALAQTAKTISIDFSVSPNPSNGELVLNYQPDLDAPPLLFVVDQNGRQVHTAQLTTNSVQYINLRHLPSGTYWLQLKSEKGKIGVKQIQITSK